MYDGEDKDGPAGEFVQLNVLVEREEEGQAGGAKPGEAAPHHQDDNEGGVEVEALTTAAGYGDLRTLEEEEEQSGREAETQG